MDKQMAELLAELEAPVKLETAYNIAPTDNIPILINASNGLAWHMAKWWFTPSWSPDPSNTKFSMFNAKSETLSQSKAFKGSFRHKRCVIPASSFIEWQTVDGDKTPYEIFNPDKPLLFAGIYDVWGNSLVSAAIITKPAAPEFEEIHKRMPTFLTTETAKLWLSPVNSLDEYQPLFTGDIPHHLSAHVVESGINNSRVKAASVSTAPAINII